MEINHSFENCTMSLGNEFKFTTSNVFDFQSTFKPEGLPKTSTNSTNVQNSIENNQNDLKYIQKPSELFTSDCSSGTSKDLLRRTSFMQLFDPLHPKQQTLNSDGDCNSIHSIGDKTELSTEIYCTRFPKEIAIKTVSNSHVHKTLISLESPKKHAKPVVPKILFSENLKPVKKYSQEDFCQTLKVQELRLQREFSQKISEYETTSAEKNQRLNSELSKLVTGNKSYSLILSEMLTILESMRTNNEKSNVKLEDLHVSHEKLKADIRTSKEDICKMESAFSDVHKRYETSKSMITSYKENEEHLIKNMESMKEALDRQDSMNEMLQSRTHDLTDKANKEVDSTKKSADTQIMILKEQLKKKELEICSLENDLKQTRSNSNKLENVYDDLMDKYKT